MKVKLLGINCSPRDNSNSHAILDYSMRNAKEKYAEELSYDIVDLNELNIKRCKACNVCGKSKDTGEFIDCVLKDKDDVQSVLDMMVAADGIAVATPVYFGMPSDLFSIFIMRTRVLRHQDFALANKAVGIMAIAGRRSGGSETTIMSSWLPFIRNGCLIVGNGDKTCQFGAVGWAGPRGHILSDEWGLEQGAQTIERIYEIAKLVKAGSQALNCKNPMTFCYTSGGRH